MMNGKLKKISGRYLARLQEYLAQSASVSSIPVNGLGRQAVALGLETLDVAKIHEQALLTLVLPNSSNANRTRMIKRAGKFFAEVITPIEETHRVALETNAQLQQLNEALSERTVELAASHRNLKQGIGRRKAVEKSLKQSGKRYTQLLQGSRSLQERSRNLTHKVLSAHEDGRRKISHELHDEIAQTLLGIHVRLVTLKQEATVNMKSLKKEITATQRLVQKSVKIVRRFARRIGANHD